MSKHLIATLSGADRVGFVENVTKRVFEFGANVEQSRMVRLGGEFSVIMLISVEDGAYSGLQAGIQKLTDEGFHVSTRETVVSPSKYDGWLPYTIEVNGADHEGIIHTVTGSLAERGINIESLSTGRVPAPMSGTPLFTMTAVVVAPPAVTLTALRAALGSLGEKLNVDTDVEPFAG